MRRLLATTAALALSAATVAACSADRGAYTDAYGSSVAPRGTIVPDVGYSNLPATPPPGTPTNGT